MESVPSPQAQECTAVPTAHRPWGCRKGAHTTPWAPCSQVDEGHKLCPCCMQSAGLGPGSSALIGPQPSHPQATPRKSVSDQTIECAGSGQSHQLLQKPVCPGHFLCVRWIIHTEVTPLILPCPATVHRHGPHFTWPTYPLGGPS